MKTYFNILWIILVYFQLGLRIETLPWQYEHNEDAYGGALDEDEHKLGQICALELNCIYLFIYLFFFFWVRRSSNMMKRVIKINLSNVQYFIMM